ncbi:MAG: sigma-70 family RNA polymerase sigma factor [Planctomycetes bacterium]|nr:sigma-70 family RNA polymerase sigma factor [Planctomycetota bacterium]
MEPEELAEQQSWLRRRARKLMGSRLRGWMESGDLAQAAQAEAWRTRGGKRFANRAAFRGWLGRILRSLAVNEARRRGLDAVPVGESGVVDGSRTPSRLAARRDSGRWVREQLRRLGERERAIVLARVVDGESFAGIAERFGCTEGNARVIFHRSLERLREHDEFGGSA